MRPHAVCIKPSCSILHKAMHMVLTPFIIFPSSGATDVMHYDIVQLMRCIALCVTVPEGVYREG
jgi:hypothetical protein